MSDLDLDALEALKMSAEAFYRQSPGSAQEEIARRNYHAALRNAAPALIAAAKREELRNRREGTHAQDCHLWGPRHYDCLKREFAAANARIAELEAKIAALSA